MKKNSKATFSLVASGLFALATTAPAFAQPILMLDDEKPEPILYEFEFAYDRDALQSERARHELDIRLNREARAYCTRLTADTEVAGSRRACHRQILRAVDQRLERDTRRTRIVASAD